MTGRNEDGNSMVGLAKRWLRTQLRFHGDPHRAARDRREAGAIEAELEDRAREEAGRAVVGALMPEGWKRKLSDWERQAEAGRAAEAQRRRREHEARPRAVVSLSLSGDVAGAIDEELPVRADRPSEAAGALTVELEPLDPLPVGDRVFRGFQFAVPHYHGPGPYNLSAMARGNGSDDWDPLWFQLWMESDEEPFYWTSDNGAAAVEVGGDERSLRVRFPMEDAGGARLVIEGTIRLP